MGHRYIVLGDAWPQVAEHTPCHSSVEFADAIPARGHFHGQNSHVEAVRIAGVLPQGQEFLAADAHGFSEGGEIHIHGIMGKHIDTCRDRRMDREYQR